jgi:hypothetical protein
MAASPDNSDRHVHPVLDAGPALGAPDDVEQGLDLLTQDCDISEAPIDLLWLSVASSVIAVNMTPCWGAEFCARTVERPTAPVTGPRSVADPRRDLP